MRFGRGIAFAAVELKSGQLVSWTNVDDSPHQVIVNASRTLRTPVILKGQSTTIEFRDPACTITSADFTRA